MAPVDFQTSDPTCLPTEPDANTRNSFHRAGFIQTRVIATSTPLSIVEGVPI